MDPQQTTLTKREFRIRREQIWHALREKVMPQLVSFIEDQADQEHRRSWVLTTTQDPKKPRTLHLTVHPRER